MSCINSVTTKTGTFTFYNEFVTKCEAELKCLKKGELLAPITKKRDANRIMKLFKSNTGKENCVFGTNSASSYWLGLDITFNKDKQEKVFSNGVRWNDKKHSKIYTDYLTEYTDCPVALFEPFAVEEPFPLVWETRYCNYSQTNKYVCFKPSNIKATAECVTQEKENVENGIFLPIGVVAAAILIFAIGAFGAGVLYQKSKVENKKEENGKEQLSLADSRSSSRTTNGKKGNVHDSYSDV